MAEESHGTQPGNAPASGPVSSRGGNEESTDAPPLARGRLCGCASAS